MDLARQVPRSVGILQARILEWVACPPTGDLPKPGIETRCPALQADSYGLSPQGSPLVDTGKRSTTSAQEAFAGVGVVGANSDSLGVGEETGRAVMGAHRVFSCPRICFGSGPEASSPGCRFLRGRCICGGCGAREMAPFMGRRGTERSPWECPKCLLHTESKRIAYRCLCGAVG